MNQKVTNLNKEKSALESEVSRLKTEIKEMKEHVGDAGKNAELQYKRFEEATLKIQKLEKDLDLE